MEKECVTAVVDEKTLEISQMNRVCNPYLNWL